MGHVCFFFRLFFIYWTINLFYFFYLKRCWSKDEMCSCLEAVWRAQLTLPSHNAQETFQSDSTTICGQFQVSYHPQRCNTKEPWFWLPGIVISRGRFIWHPIEHSMPGAHLLLGVADSSASSMAAHTDATNGKKLGDDLLILTTYRRDASASHPSQAPFCSFLTPCGVSPQLRRRCQKRMHVEGPSDSGTIRTMSITCWPTGNHLGVSNLELHS